MRRSRPASAFSTTVYSLVRTVGARVTTSALRLIYRQRQKMISVEQLSRWRWRLGWNFLTKIRAKWSQLPPATDNVMAVNILFIFLKCPRGRALSLPSNAASQAPALFHPSLSFWLTAGTVHLHRSAVGFFQGTRLSPPESLKIDYSGDRITLVQFLKECSHPFIVEDLDQKWSTKIIILNWKVILEAQGLEQPLDNRHMESRNRDWERLNTSWGCRDTKIWDLRGLDKSFCIPNTTPVLQAELNPNTHATAMIKSFRYSVRYGYK